MELTQKHLKAIELIASGKTDKQVGESLKLTDRQIRLWKTDPAFKFALNLALSDIFQASINKIKTATNSAASTLQEIMEDRNAPPQPRIRAAEIILSTANQKSDLSLLEAIEVLVAEGVLEQQTVIQIQEKLDSFKNEIKNILSNNTADS